MEIIKYPDGTGYVKEKEFKNDIVTFKVNTYENLWQLRQYVDVCNYNGYIPNILIPNLIDAQADRRFNSNESSGLKLVCEFLNSMQANFTVFHPHNAEVVEALITNVKILDNANFIKQVLYDLQVKEYFSVENLQRKITLFSSDAGGFKPLMKLCDKIDWRGLTFSASKARRMIGNFSKLEQRIDYSDFNGRDILIIDDICVYGGTFKGLATMLRERNCGKLYLAVSHITIEHHPQDSVFEYFDKVFTTNSKFDEYTAENHQREMLTPQNLEIIRMFNNKTMTHEKNSKLNIHFKTPQR